jgi:hypothetical protein
MDPYSHWGVDEADTSLVGQRLVSSKQLLRRVWRMGTFISWFEQWKIGFEGTLECVFNVL